MKQRRWVGTAYGDLQQVIMHRPGIELDLVTEKSLREFNFDAPVDANRFLHEYDTMVSILDSHGVQILFLADILKEDGDALSYMARRPNMTYTRDLAVVFATGAVLMGPHLKGRWGDQEMMARAFRRLGVPIIGAVEHPGFLEGGGVTMIGDDVAVASLCDRANESGTRMLREFVLGRDVKYFLEVPLPFGHIHIDGVFMMLDERLCLMHEATFELFPCRLYEDGVAGVRHVMFREFLDQRGIEMIPLRDNEREGGHLNVVVTRRGRSVVGFAEAERIASELETRGWRFDTFPSRELFQGNGGAHCMTCPLEVG